MKLLALALVLASAAAAPPYLKRGGYKIAGKYDYKYTAHMNVKLPQVDEHYTQLQLDAQVTMHMLENDEALLEVSGLEVEEVTKDPRANPETVNKVSPLTQLLKKFVRLPVKFLYKYGLVYSVHARRDDPEWSVNLKKSIINLFNVDIRGEDKETGYKTAFTKPETSVFGICPTTYYMNDHMTWNGKEWAKLGMNITRVIDTVQCTLQKYSVSDSVVQGPLNEMEKSHFDTSAMFQYNIIGNELGFKIESVNASGVYAIYPFSRNHDSVVATTFQKLVLIREGGSLIKENRPEMLENLEEIGRVIVSVPEIEKPDFLLNWKAKDYENLALMIYEKLAVFVRDFVPEETPEELVKKFTPKESEAMLIIINSLRLCKHDVMETIWNRCDEKTRKWYVYLLTACQTDDCLEFMMRKIQSGNLPEATIKEYLMSASFIGKPSTSQVENMLKICELEKIRQVPHLKIACFVATSNLVKTLCKIRKVCTTSFQTRIFDMLKRIDSCQLTDQSCFYVEDIPTPIIFSIMENIIVSPDITPELPVVLERIIMRDELPTEIRVKAIWACRPLIKIIPSRLRLILMRLFYDVALNTEVRMTAFAVMMENPTAALIQMSARHLLKEPSLQLRRFVYDFIYSIAHESPKFKYSEEIIRSCHVSLRFFTRSIAPTGLIHNSRHWEMKNEATMLKAGSYITVNSISTNEEILPRFLQSSLNVTLFGRTFSLLDAEVRMEGVQDYLEKLLGVKGRLYERKSVLDLIQKDASTLRQRAAFKRSPEEMKVHSVVKVLDKIFYMDYTTTETSFDLKNLLLKGAIFRAAALESELEKGKVFTMFKPIIPVDVVYKLPTLLGVPLHCNFTSILMPRVKTQVKAMVKPHFFSTATLLSKERDYAEMSVKHGVSGVAHVISSVFFGLPVYDIGLTMSSAMTYSAMTGGKVVLDIRTKRYTLEIEAPKETKDLLTIKTERYHFIKPYPVPETSVPTTFTKLVVRPDDVGEWVMLGIDKRENVELLERPDRTNLEEEVLARTLSRGVCGVNSAHMRVCAHGYYTKTKQTLRSILSPMEMRVRITPLSTTPEKIVLEAYQDEESKERSRYTVVFQSVKEGKPATHITVKIVSEQSQAARFRVDVTPAYRDLLNAEKMCFEQTITSGSVKLWLSMDRECSVKHLKVNLLAKPLDKVTKILRKILVETSYSVEKLPKFWKRLLERALTKVIPALYANSERVRQVQNWKINNIPYGSAAVEIFVSPKATVKVNVRTPELTFMFGKMSLPFSIKTVPVGSNKLPTIFKMGQLLYPFCSYQSQAVKTFDNIKFNYKLKRECPHILIQNCSSGIAKFVVLVRKMRGEQQSHALRIEIDNTDFDIIPREDITQKPVLMINGKAQDFDDSHFMYDTHDRPVYAATWDAEHRSLVFMHYRLGLVMSLEKGRQIRAQISPLYYNKVCGMCGNFDGEKSDELLTPGNRIVVNPQEFGESWILPGSTCERRFRF